MWFVHKSTVLCNGQVADSFPVQPLWDKLVWSWIILGSQRLGRSFGCGYFLFWWETGASRQYACLKLQGGFITLSSVVPFPSQQQFEIGLSL